jgi:tetratricopeptide (TPR) repeat protein
MDMSLWVMYSPRHFFRLLLSIAVIVFSMTSCLSRPTSDYEIELSQTKQEIAALNFGDKTTALTDEKMLELVSVLYRQFLLTGIFVDFKLADQAIDKAMHSVGGGPDLYLLRARLDFSLHRFAQTKTDLKRVSELAGAFPVQMLHADLMVQEGKYAEAKKAYEKIIRKKRTWDGLARLAYLQGIIGDYAGAEALYIEAENEISAKEMRAYAWLKVQRGHLAFNQGHHDIALRHYLGADQAYSGYWLVQEHLAELFGAQRRYNEAEALYLRVIANTPKPELWQALGDLYVFMGSPERAKPWHEKALVTYLESVQNGEVLYLHHLAGFYADVLEEGSEAVRWARKDLALRAGPNGYDALAWALYRDGQFDAAFREMQHALQSGVNDAHVYFHAAMISLAAGKGKEGNHYLQLASASNPHFDAFHVHR